MKKETRFAILWTVAMVLSLGIATIANAGQPDQSGKHYNLNIIGFANCTMQADGVYPDCFNGQPGPGGHVIFVPLKTRQENVCDTGTTLTEPITNAQLQKGVRILVTDGPDLEVLDKDATDGTASFQIPNGCYDVFASAGGKPGGCADIDTLICCTDVDNCSATQVDCKPNLILNTAYGFVGHIDVDRTTGKPHWDRVTDELLGAGGSLVANDGYYDFFWQIFNDHLRVLHLRIESVSCGG